MSNSLKIAIVSTMIAVVLLGVCYFASVNGIPSGRTGGIGHPNTPDSRADMLIYRGVVDTPSTSVAKGGDR